MTGASRAIVLVVADSADDAMLREWLTAAGFQPCHERDLEAARAQPGATFVATLVQWPSACDVDRLPQPVVALHPPGQPPGEMARVAVEVLEMPDRDNMRSLLSWSSRLSAVLRLLAAGPQATATAPVAPPPVEPGLAAADKPVRARPSVIVIGISTGGPTSLRVFFEGLRAVAGLPPIVIVQHIPHGYVADMCQRLREQTGYDVQMARDGGEVVAGSAYVAPGNRHLRLLGTHAPLRTVYDERPPIRGHCPSVEVLFESCARVEPAGIAVMMTGMGRDGADAMLRLRQAGWSTVGQNAETCAIYGMPRAAREVGAVERELPLPAIAPWLVGRCRPPRTVT